MNRAEPHPFRLVLGIVLILALAWFLYIIRSILTPFVVAFLASYALMSIVDKIEDMGMKRWLAILIVYLLFGIVIATLMAILVPTLRAEFQSIQANFNVYLEILKKRASESSWGKRFGIAEEINKWGNALGNYALKKVPGFISNVFSMAMFMIIVPLATFFLLKDTRAAKRAIVERVPNKLFEMALSLVWRTNQQLKSYIQGQLLTILIVGLSSVIGLRLINLKYYAVVGIGTGIINVIPYVGPLIALVASVLVALVTSGSGQMVTLAILVCLAVQLIDNVTKPFIMAKSVSMHPLTVMFVVLIGGKIFGALGMILAVPVASIIKVTGWTVYEEFEKRAMLLQAE